MQSLMTNSHIYSTFTALGDFVDDQYVVSTDCLAILQEILYKLSTEDHTLRTYRRAIGFGNNISNDLVPLLIHAKDPKIIDETIRLLVNLTVPIECLLSVEVMSRTEIGRHTIFELNNLLMSAKKAFSEACGTRAIIDRMKTVLECETKVSMEYCAVVNNCLLLLRNILHGSVTDTTAGVSVQNKIIWNLFTQSIDKLLLHLITCNESSYWSTILVQLIALLYKDQHDGTLQNLLNMWFEASLSESSDDNESNTSPPKQCSGDSSPMLTSDPTSDSSDTGKSEFVEENQMTRIQNSLIRSKIQNTQRGSLTSEGTTESEQRTSSGVVSLDDQSHASSDGMKSSNDGQTTGNQKVFSQNSGNSTGKGNKKAQTKLELSDCGYSTQKENQESISTSSNEDEFKPIHQKPPPNQKQRYNAVNNPRKPITLQEQKEFRRKKLVKRGKCSIINMKGIMHHSPTDEDISNVLKEFTIDFLLKGYGHLVKELHAQLLNCNNMVFPIDISHFFWLITYFLKFAAKLELDLDRINTVLCYDIISYMTYEGVNLCEQIQLDSKSQDTDLKPSIRRMHLVVRAISEFLQALETYTKISHLSDEDKIYIKELRFQIANTLDLRSIFVLLLRVYNPYLQNRQYLQDLITTNHIFLSLLDDIGKLPDFKGFPKDASMVQHIKQFATVEIMHHYGLLLENFRTNNEFVNDCIFTMMHHVGGDLGQVSILFQPGILKTFSNIWESEYEICDDWSDLIEYVIHKFINHQPQHVPLSSPNPIIVQPVAIAADTNRVWTKEEMDTLYWYYIQSKSNTDVVGSIIKLFAENGNSHKDRIAMIQQLLKQDIISLSEFDALMKFEDNQYVRIEKPNTCGKQKEEETSVDDIKLLKDRLIKENKGHIVHWLQKVLMECCFIKLRLDPDEAYEVEEGNNHIMEPLLYHYILKNQSVPIVPWNTEQHCNMTYQPFVLLLHKLGFHLPDDTNRLWVRIPNFWVAKTLFIVADKLGPIDKSLFKFDINYFDYKIPKETQNERNGSISPSKKLLEKSRSTPEPSDSSSKLCDTDDHDAERLSKNAEGGDYSLDTTQLSVIVRQTRYIRQSSRLKLEELENILEMPDEGSTAGCECETNEQNNETQQGASATTISDEHEVVSINETTASAASDLLMFVSDDEEKSNADVGF